MEESTTLAHDRFKIGHVWSLLKQTYTTWNADEPFRLSAIIAYYAVLSMPALMVIIINTVGAIWGTEIVAGQLHSEITSTLGADAASSIEEMVSNSQKGEKSLVSTILGIAVLVYGSTGVFYQLQQSLNTIWGVRTDPKAGWKKLVLDRAQSFGFILVIGFLLLVSLVATAGISAMEGFITSRLPDITYIIMTIVNALLSLAVITGLFALMFKFLPDARIRWRTVWLGAFITALLFTIGKTALGIYFGQSDPGSAYGAAGSIILILLWTSYSSLILFFGAKFTRVWAERYGEGVTPAAHAEKLA